MRIAILYVPGCPNLDLARARVREALDATGVDAAVTETEVATAEAAEQAGMRGSPTILIDGRDRFAGAAEPRALACRLYRTDATLEGAPSVGELVDAVTA